MTTRGLIPCDKCNGHGFLVVTSVDGRDRSIAEHLDPMLPVETNLYGPPADQQAGADCSDLDPRPCSHCRGWGMVKQKEVCDV